MLIKTRKFSFLCLVALIGVLFLPMANAQDTSLDTEQLAACAFPDLPEMVDGSNTDKEAMTRMGTQVREFIVSIEASLTCLDNAAGTASPDKKAVIDHLYNNGVDQLNFIAKQYNEQVRRFKRYQQVLDSTLHVQDPNRR